VGTLHGRHTRDDEKRASVIHIAVDAWNLIGNRRGTGRYVRSILSAWRESYAERVRVTLIVPELFAFTVRGKYLREADGGAYPVRSRAHPGAFDAWWFPFNGPSWDTWRGASVATLHDALPFSDGYAESERISLRRAAKMCGRLVTDSAFSAQALAGHLGIAPDRITPVLLGARTMAPGTLPALSFPRFVLYVGDTDERKDLRTLYAAVRIARERFGNLGIVHIGPNQFGLPQNDGLDVVSLGVVDDATLAAAYRACTAFVFPSRYEGFGLPVLEAMANGAPVVSSSAPALPEVGVDAVLYAEPGDVAGFASAIMRIAGDDALAADLRARGQARAAERTWARTGGELLAVFEQLLERRGRAG
jgi:glycosyltransferase involved in cell wall biosynthesis